MPYDDEPEKRRGEEVVNHWCLTLLFLMDKLCCSYLRVIAQYTGTGCQGHEQPAMISYETINQSSVLCIHTQKCEHLTKLSITSRPSIPYAYRKYSSGSFPHLVP